jgi:hypothetical protein
MEPKAGDGRRVKIPASNEPPRLSKPHPIVAVDSARPRPGVRLASIFENGAIERRRRESDTTTLGIEKEGKR